MYVHLKSMLNSMYVSKICMHVYCKFDVKNMHRIMYNFAFYIMQVFEMC